MDRSWSANDRPERLFFSSQGLTAMIHADGSGLRYFDFQVPDQVTWQPGPFLSDGRRIIFLSMEERRDGPGRPFDQYYHQTPTHPWPQDGQILFPRRLSESKVAWEFQPHRPDTDHFNRDFTPERTRGGTEIYRLDPNTGSMVSLTQNEPPDWDFRASASPNGRRTAFCRAETGGVPELYVMGSCGSSPRLLTNGWEGRGADHPSWLPSRTSEGRRYGTGNWDDSGSQIYLPCY